MSLPDLLRAAGVVAGLLLPGTGWALAGRWPLPWFGGGLLSAALLFTGVLGLHFVGVPVTALSLAGWLVVAGLPGWWRWWERRTPSPAAAASGRAWLLALPALPLLLVAGWRAVTQPLAGADAVFRWNLLAELIARQGSLAGYPAVTTGDFTRYFWADGIAPQVSSLYAWTYLVMGRTALVWTALPVLLQVAGLLALLFGLGRAWHGPRGGWLACAAGGGTMLLQFAFNLGQETGLTTLGVGGMVLYLLAWADRREDALLVPAAVAATVAACAREYGLGAVLVGALWVGGTSRRLKPALLFAAFALVLPATWHLRVWALTGNPWYAQALPGFPTNPVFAAWMDQYHQRYGRQLLDAAVWREWPRLVAITVLPALAGAGAGAWLWRRTRGTGLVVALGVAFTALWLASVPYTAGGLFYAMRVLAPAVVLGCAWAGAAVARLATGGRARALALAVLGGFAVDASLRALTIPLNPYLVPAREWATAGDRYRRDFEAEDAPFLRAAVGRVTGRVLSDSAGLQDFFAAAGRTYSPLWSPEVAWLFAGAPVPEAAARLRQLGFSHLLLKRSAITTDFLAATGALASLDGHLRVEAANATYILLALEPGAVR